MSAGTKIEWTDRTWNVVSGCTKVSPACDHCYIERTPPFRMARRRFDKPGAGGTTGVTLHRDRLGQPLTWKKPQRVFVCSLADLFHDKVSDDFLADVFGMMAHARRHTFQVLTKRHDRMRKLLNSPAFRDAVADRVLRDDPAARSRWAATSWPLPNVWLGVTAENEKWYAIRASALIDTPAAVRFVSCEPLLSRIDLSPWRHDRLEPNPGSGPHRGIHWVIAGGETGPGARPSDPAWFRLMRDQCQAGNVPFFFKQWGDWAPTGAGVAHVPGYKPDPTTRPRKACFCGPDPTDFHTEMARVGKRAAGRELDGRTWDEFPEVAS